MMRSLYSGVSGLKVHQTKMDVIGNNISNVNTTGFKASTVVFSDILYQTTQSATGPNAETGTAGQNAKQIGLGANLASITTSIKTTGGSQRTDNPFDLMITGDSFFIVNSSGQNYFTKAGSFNVDALGTLCTATGATVMGWQTNDKGEIQKDTVSALQVMKEENLKSEPEATKAVTITGNIDQNDPQLSVTTADDDTMNGGRPFTMSFYDNLGNSYTARFIIYKDPEADAASTEATTGFLMKLTDILDAEGESALVTKTVEDGKTTYAKNEAFCSSIKFGAGDNDWEVDETTGKVTVTGDAQRINFNTATGAFAGVGEESDGENVVKSLKFCVVTENGPFPQMSESNETDGGVTVDFSGMTMYSTSGSSAIESKKGDADGADAGRKVGSMTGISVDKFGKIYGSYDNGTEKLLGQVAVATFANAAGLESVGNSMFAQTQNSGEFDGIGQDISQNGGYFTSGVLEMSNVDLSSEFTQMITTQRGFQANSRIITTSDTLLDELINLKR